MSIAAFELRPINQVAPNSSPDHLDRIGTSDEQHRVRSRLDNPYEQTDATARNFALFPA